LAKKFKQGDPCGDIVRTIAEFPTNVEISGSLATIVAFVEAMKHRSGNCINCPTSEDFQESLMKCTRCELNYYCSKQGQKGEKVIQ
jgi:hypothetical protein